VGPDKQKIYNYLDSQGVSYSLGDNESELITNHILGSFEVAIRAVIPKNFPCLLPYFHLIDRNQYGALAHIAWGEGPSAEICYGRGNNLSADLHDPGRVFFEALSRALLIVEKSLNDQNYNKEELLREFAGVWRFHVKSSNRLICIAEPTDKPFLLDIRSSIKGANGSIDKRTYAIDTLSPCNDSNFFLKKSQDKGRNVQGKGAVVPISPLLVPPEPCESIESWWRKQLDALCEEQKRELKKILKRTKTREFYILCHAEYKSDTIWFGIHCTSEIKQYAPLTPSNFCSWTFEAIHIDVISHKLLVPRAGGRTDLREAKICVVGCGSVGGYIADMLASSGVGKLTLIDNDIFEIENLHRHFLNPIYLFWLKAMALKHYLELKYPFVKIEFLNKDFLDIEESEFWMNFDSIIIAIGAASYERKFNEYIRSNQINTPVITTWVEPFGVGGHAVATIPEKNGCLACAYINNENDLPDLYPNLSFVARDQYVLQSLGGCGTEFMAFSSIDSMQTANIAAKLALRSVKGEIPHGISVSWRSDSPQAKDKGLIFTHRYLRMKSNLEDVDIRRDECPICGY